jgi:uncharacterized protein (DUF1810 family)
MMSDPFNLERFVAAQSPVYTQVTQELRAGHKRSHWMWFVFPQIRGLGNSDFARLYAISSRDEAEAYLAHPVLGPRLRECTQLVNAVQGRSSKEIFGHPDYLKFHSSMTLFSLVVADEAVFTEALNKYYGGKLDDATVERL